MDIVKNLIMDEVRKDMEKQKIEYKNLKDEYSALKDEYDLCRSTLSENQLKEFERQVMQVRLISSNIILTSY